MVISEIRNNPESGNDHNSLKYQPILKMVTVFFSWYIGATFLLITFLQIFNFDFRPLIGRGQNCKHPAASQFLSYFKTKSIFEHCGPKSISG